MCAISSSSSLSPTDPKRVTSSINLRNSAHNHRPPSSKTKAQEPICAETYSKIKVKMEPTLKPPAAPPTPQYMFFYGTLMDPALLQTVAGLAYLPQVRKATLKGFKPMMWGEIYPTLLRFRPSAPSEESPFIPGVVWKVESPINITRLAEYETNAYKLCFDVDVDLEEEDRSGSEVLKGCGTFIWAGEEDDEELEEGLFDLRRYQIYFKPFGAHY